MKTSLLIKSALLAALGFASVTASAQAGMSQHWSPWATETLGWGPGTISQYGAAITCIASVQYARGDTWASPSTWNQWGKNNSGFSGNLVIWGAYPGYQALRDYSAVPADLNWINGQLDSGNMIIAKTYIPPSRTVETWVLIYYRQGNTYYMMDPRSGYMGLVFNTDYGDPARWIYRCASYR